MMMCQEPNDLSLSCLIFIEFHNNSNINHITGFEQLNISRINILGPPLGRGRGGDEIRRNQGRYSGKRPRPPAPLPSPDVSLYSDV